MTKSTNPERGARFLLVTASVVLVVAGLKAIKFIALPLLLAIFLSILSAPLLAWLTKHRIPKPVAVVTAVLANVLVMALLLLLIGNSINAFADSIPRYQERVEAKVEKALDWLEEQGVDTSELDWLRQESLLPEELMAGLPSANEGAETAPNVPRDENDEPSRGTEPTFGELVNLGSVIDLIGATLRSIASVLGMTLLVFLLMVFILFEASGLPMKLEDAFGWRDDVMGRFTSEIQRYLLIKTLVSLATGFLVGLGLWLSGVGYPLLWGLLAFLFNYVPNVGSIIASAPPFFLTWLDAGVGKAVLVAMIYVAVNITLGNFIEPHLMGRQFGISTLVVVLSLIFWGWLWGPVGMLLSVPLTMIVKIMLENTEDLRWVARLIGANPRPGAVAKSLEMTNPTLAGTPKG